jgi:50S ribosomal protein L16 3-hydroxylase
MARNPPAGIDPEAFMKRHWQREPLLVRGAFPGFRDPLAAREVLALAASPEASSRLVRRRGSSWSLQQGPFSSSRFKQLPRRDWTVLVQDVNHASDRADALLARFDFIPHARVDDVMVSYAVPGGGVGPHVDSYDVFLVQGAGRRRWQISRQADHSFVPGLDLRILERFVPEEEWVLEAGDMLYLPPGIAHDGVAQSECLTWSIGFRAPADRELTAAFLDFLQQRIEDDAGRREGAYADPGAPAAEHAAEIPAAMIEHAAQVVAAIQWSAADVREFAGRHLSEPKNSAVFGAPRRPLSRAQFAKLAARRGLRLDRCSRLLFSGTMFFMNGETAEIPARARTLVARLADERSLAGPLPATAEFWDVIYRWYAQGYLHAGGPEET